jgi:sec-independent protein translocase protein TatB
MFDFDAGKLILIGIVALIVIGPKDLPRVLRELGRAVAKMRRMATEFQGQFMEAVREADMADIKDEVAKLTESARVDVPFNPVADIKNEIMSAVDRPSPSAALSAPPPDLVAAEASSPKALPEGQGAGSTYEEAAQKPDHAPDTGIDAEMQALADALKAEIGAAPQLDAAHARGRVSTLRDNA